MVSELLEHAKMRPEMMGIERTYQSAKAFLEGVNLATGRFLLDGIDEWVVKRLNLPEAANCLVWSCHVARAVCPERWDTATARTQEDEATIFDSVMVCAIDFIRDNGRDRAVRLDGGQSKTRGA